MMGLCIHWSCNTIYNHIDYYSTYSSPGGLPNIPIGNKVVMNRIIIMLALMFSVALAWLFFGQVLDLNAAVAPSGSVDTL